MKIIITESQVKNIISEIVNDEEMDSLLDKINVSGIDSLTPDEKERMERMSYGEEPEDLSYVKLKFFEYFPEDFNFKVNNEVWHAYETEKDSGDRCILITNSTDIIECYPFYKGDNKFVYAMENGNKFTDESKYEAPKDDDEIRDFVDRYTSVILPMAVQYFLEIKDTQY